MNCKKCGSPLVENDQFCKNCGEAVNSQVANMSTQPVMGAQPNASVPPVVGIEPTVNAQPVMNTQPTVNAQPAMGTQPNVNVQPTMTAPNNTTQQGWANYNNAPMYNNQPVNKPSGNGKYIIIGLAIVVGIVVIILVVSMLMNKGENPSKPVADNPGSVQPSNSNYKVNFKGFTLEIPDNYVYQEKTDSLMVGNEEGTWAAVIEIGKGSYSQLKTNKNRLQTSLQQGGFNVSAPVEKTISGVEFITLEGTVSGQNQLIAITKANSMYFICLTAMNQDNEFDYTIIENLAPIFKTIKYTGEASNSIAVNGQIDMNALSELAK